MSYQINLTNGTALTVINDRSTDNSTSLSLVGRGSVEFGTAILENFVYLLENFSATTPPARPLVGQLWFDSANTLLKMYTATNVWLPVSDNGAFGVTGQLAQGTLITGETSAQNRLAGTMGVVLTGGAGSTTVAVTFAEGTIVSCFSEFAIPFIDLPLTIVVSGYTIPFSGMFPNGIVPGHNMSRQSKGLIYAGTTQFSDVLAAVPFLLGGDDQGAVNALLVTVPAVLSAYAKYLKISTTIKTTNTGASTVNVNGLGVVSVLRADGTPTQAGDLIQGEPVDLVFDGTAFRIDSSVLTTQTTAINSVPTIAAAVATNATAIQTETSNRMTADAALAQQITTLTSTIGSNTTSISNEATTRANAIAALAQQITTLTATVQTNSDTTASNYSQVTTTQATQNNALTSQITTLTSQMTNTIASLTQEIQTRTTDSTSFSTSIQSLMAEVAGSSAVVQNMANTSSSATDALSTQLTTLQTTVDANSTAISNLQSGQSTDVSALTSTVTTLQATVGQNTSDISTEQTARAAADTAINDSISTLTSNVNGNISTLQTTLNTTSSLASTTSTAVTNLTSTVNTNNAAFQSFLTSYATDKSATSTQITNLSSTVDANYAAYQGSLTTQATTNSSLTQLINNLTTTVGQNTSSIQTLQSSSGGTSVQYSLSGSINGTTGGFDFTGVLGPNGVTYNMTFNSNVTINGTLLVNGSVAAGKISRSSLTLNVATDTIPNGSVYVPVNWTTVTNTLTNSTYSNGTLTIGAGDDGLYLMTGIVVFSALAQDIVMLFLYNSTQITYSEGFTPGYNDSQGVSSTTFQRVNVGDTLRMGVYQQNIYQTTNKFRISSVTFTKISS